MKKKLLVSVFSLIMIITMIPINVFANSSALSDIKASTDDTSASIDYLSFEAVDGNVTLSMDKESTAPEVSYQYSTDKDIWEEFIPGDTSVTVQNGEKIYFRSAEKDQDFPGNSQGQLKFIMNDKGSNGKIKACGNIMSLVSQDCTIKSMEPYGFCKLFQNCTPLESSPELPAETLAESCYESMFYGCTELTSAPVLSAQTLAASCYESMFSECSSLEKAPNLTAEVICVGCYENMFYNCKALTDGPKLPAKNLDTLCYNGMFSGCSNLKNLEVGFSSWNDARQSTWNWLSNVSDQGVLYCPKDLDTSLRDGSHIPAGWTTSSADDYMYFTATSGSVEVIIYGSGPDTTYQYSKKRTFDECAPFIPNKTKITINQGETVFLRSAVETQDFPGKYNMYFEITGSGKVEAGGNIMSLVSQDCSVNTMAEKGFYRLFDGCSPLTKAPNLPAETLAPSCYSNMFYNCENLKVAPDLPAETLADSCYDKMFYGCTIVNTPTISAKNLANNCCNEMFYGCDITKAPELAATKLATNCYWGMFEMCIYLTEPPKLPAQDLAEGCYFWMFYGCSLTVAPELPAKKLVKNCYGGMFEDCEKLNRLTVNFTDWNEQQEATSNWLEGVATSGYFICPEELNKEQRNESHIPEYGGWKVSTYDYLSLKAVDGDVNVSLKKVGHPGGTHDYEYSYDKENWTHLIIDSTNIFVSKNKTVYFRSTSEMQDFPYVGNDNGISFTMNTVSGGDGKIEASGNLMSLVSKYCFERELPSENGFGQLFMDCTLLTKAPEIPNGNLDCRNHKQMFCRCTNLQMISVKFTDWNEGSTSDEPTREWVYLVPSGGTFYCPNGLEIEYGKHHIPEGWNVVQGDCKIDFTSEGSMGEECGYFDSTGKKIESLTISKGTTFTISGEDQKHKKTIIFTYPGGQTKKITVCATEGYEIKDFQSPETSILSDCEFITTFDNESCKVSLASDKESDGSGAYYNGETKIDSIDVPYNTGVTATKISDDEVQIVFDDVATVIAKADKDSEIEKFTLPETPIKSSCTLSTKFVKKPIKQVTFDMQGHGKQIEPQTVYEGETATKPEDPQEEGYTFDGWFKEAACENEFDFDTQINADTTLYAKWTAIPYAINKTASEGVSSISAQVEGTEAEQATIGTTVSVSAFPDTTYQIQNITITPSDTKIDPIVITGDQGQFTMPASDVTITATAEHVAQHEVAFDMQGHGQQIESQAVYDGLTVDRPSDPQEAGYEFGGWYTEKECVNEFDFATPIKADTTLYAKWIINTYTVTFDVQGHGTAPDAQLVDYNDKAQKPADPSEGGYTFDGWYTEKECVNEFDFATPIKADTTLYAKWTAIQYAINKTTSEGISSISAQVEGTEAEHATIGTTVSVSALPDITYQIQNITITPSDTTIDPIVITGDQGQFTMPASDVVITASAEHVAQHEVTFDMQGHGQQIESQAVYDGQTATKPEEPRERGYVFDGWFNETGCENEFDFNTPITGDTVLYAKWTALKVPQVTGLDAKAIDSKTASVTWNKVTGFDEVKYEVWRKAGDSGTFKKIATTTSNSYKDTKVITGTKYYYEVRAICTASGEIYTGEFSETDHAYPCLYQVTKLSAIALNAADVRLKWNANGNKNVVYQVYRSTKPDSGFKKVATITDGKTSFSQSFTPEQSGKKYYYKVRAITKDYTGKCHYGAFSKVDFAYPRVHAVVGFKAWAPNAKSVKVYFKPLPNQNTKYWLYKSTKPSGNWGSPIAKLSCKDNLYTDKKVKAGHKYYYVLRPVEVINGKTYLGPYTKMDYAYPR